MKASCSIGIFFAVGVAACSDPGASGGAGSGAVADSSPAVASFDTSTLPKADAKSANDAGQAADSAAAETAVADGAALDAAAVAETAATLDAAPPPDSVVNGNFGSPCKGAADCDSGLCVESSDGKVCGKLCAGDCDAGWTCAQLQIGSSDMQFVCVPTYARLCDPCATASDCNPIGVTGGVCLPAGKNGNDGSFCAMKCLPGSKAACPSGYDCKPALGGFACQPKSGACACSPAAKAKQLATSCATENSVGTCLGLRICGDGGLGDCNAPVAAAETCDSADNDCNGKTDDVAQTACETKNEFGACKGKVTGCDNGNALCNAAVPKPETCNQIDDDCDGKTDEDLCEDGNPCTAGSCNPDGSCKQTPASGPCDDGDVCTLADACSNGTCQGSAAKKCDDGNPCTADFCDPKAGCQAKAADPGTACQDDGNPCTLDQCSNGKCAHPNAPGTVACADDGNPCTTDQCVGGNCEHLSAAPGSPCTDDGDPCTDDACQGVSCVHSPAKIGTACADDGDPCTGDTCDGAGNCKHPIGSGICKIAGKCIAATAKNPSNPCEVCDPAQSQVGYVQKDGLACDDGNACTSNDACKAGKCAGAAKSCASLDGECVVGTCSVATGACAAVPKPANTACSDGNACTTTDVCNGTGTCAGKAVDCSVLSDGCNTGVCTNGTCLKQQKPANTACSDNDACTLTDVCTAGICKGKTMDCSAKADACNDGVCGNGVCAAKPKADNTVCTDNNPCTVSDACKAGKCTGTSTADAAEPNNSSPGKTLIDKSDCDALSQMTATISPIGDVDWYFFNSKDDAFCTVKPQAKIENLAADYDVCVYFECASGSTGSGTVSCAQGSKVSGGPNNSWGCCSTNSGTTNEFAKVSPSCSFLGTGNDGGKTWVKVTAKAGATCGGYTLYWGAKD